MRTIDSSTLVKKPSNLAWWHSSWTGRLVLAALLVAAIAMVMLPNRASAQPATVTLDARELCQVDTGTGSNGAIEFANAADAAAAGDQIGLIIDCARLVAMANSLDDDDAVGATPDVNWIDEVVADLQGANALLTTAGVSGWDGVTITDTDGTDGAPYAYRVTAIDLSGQGLSGDIPRWVWEHFTERLDGDLDNDGTADDPELNLGGNPDLAPSPPLGLTAEVTKEDDGQTGIALSWDHSGWYIQNEISRFAHSYQYCQAATCGDGDWKAETVTYTQEDGTAVLAPDTPNDKGDRANLAIADLAAANTYIIQVRAVKVDPGTDPAVTTDDTEIMSRESRLDPVGPQTLTAEFDASIEVKVAYSSATSAAEDTVLPDPTVTSETDDSTTTRYLNFEPKVETDEGSPVTVTLTQAHGMHTFPVTILAADTAPMEARRIPNRELPNDGRAVRIDLSRYFTGDDITYTFDEGARPDIIDTTLDQDRERLTIIPERIGQTWITVTAENPNRGMRSQSFRITVIDPNNAPSLVGVIPNLTLYLDDTGTQVDMRQYFRDEDNDFLRFIPQSANPMVVTATAIGPNVIFNVVGLGETRMTIIAEDDSRATAFGSFTITVLDPNLAPEAVGEVPPQEVRVDGEVLTLDVAQYFRDANNDPLTYTARSSDTDNLAVEVDGSALSLTAVSPGEVSVTIRATDPGGKSATQEMLVVVLSPNLPPEAAATFMDQVLQSDDNPLGLVLTTYFTDPNGDDMRFTAVSSDEAVATASVQGDNLTVVPVAAGEAEITVTAIDALGASFSMSFMVTVVANVSPVAVGTIEDQVVLEGGDDLIIAIGEYFNDDNGDELTYSADSTNREAVNAVILENYIADLAAPDPATVLALRPGSTDEESVDVTVTVTATDPDGESATQIVMVTLLGSAPPPTPTPTPEPTAMPTPEPTAMPTPAPTATPEPEEGGFPIAVIVIIVLLLAGAAAVVFIIQRRR